MDLKSVLEDCRINTVGGLCAGIDIWELSIIPYLLNNSEVWADIPKGALVLLDDLQNMFYRYLFATPRSTPTPALLWETGGLMMKYRIVKRKLGFFHHLSSLESSSVASRVARVEDRAGYPGLVQEYKSHCAELGLSNPTKYSKLSWKNSLKNAIIDANRKCLLDEIKRRYEKLDHETLKNEKYEIKDYVRNLTLHDGRLRFQIRSKMVRSVKFNYTSDPKYSSQLWLCTHCDKMDSQSHIIKCESYKHLREGKSLENDKDLVDYFREVISLREKLEEMV